MGYILEGRSQLVESHADVRRHVKDPAVKTVLQFGADMKPRLHPLVVFFNIDSYMSRRPDDVNITTEALVEGHTPKSLQWFGPVLVMKSLTNDMKDFVDVDMNDLDDLRSFFALCH